MTARSPHGNFTGTGWAFPPAFTAGGADVVLVQDEQDIFESLQILLSTSLGERVLREDYGCNLRDYLFEELDQRLLNNLRLAVTNSVRQHETRIDLEDIGFNIQADLQQSTIHIRISFRVRSTNSRYNLVYPFYLTESTLGPAGGGASRRSVSPAPPLPVPISTGDDTDTDQPKIFEAFLHRPTAQSTRNWSVSYTVLDDERLNGKPEAIFFVTSLWGIMTEGGPTLDPYEVGYLETEKRWAIFSKNPGVRMRYANNTPYFFYVLIAPEAAIREKYAFVHRAANANIRYNHTLIDNAANANNNPGAFVLVTPRKSAHTNHEVCVAYFADGIDQWAIANAVSDGNASSLPGNAITNGAEFNVLVLPGNILGNLHAFSHQANPDNITSNGTWLDNPLVNGKTGIFLYFTQAWRPEFSPQQGAHCPYHCQWWFDHPKDGWDTYKNDHWLIWAPNGSIPAGTVFNVFVLTDS